MVEDKFARRDVCCKPDHRLPENTKLQIGRTRDTTDVTHRSFRDEVPVERDSTLWYDTLKEDWTRSVNSEHFLLIEA